MEDAEEKKEKKLKKKTEVFLRCINGRLYESIVAQKIINIKVVPLKNVFQMFSFDF